MSRVMMTIKKGEKNTLMAVKKGKKNTLKPKENYREIHPDCRPCRFQAPSGNELYEIPQYFLRSKEQVPPVCRQTGAPRRWATRRFS